MCDSSVALLARQPGGKRVGPTDRQSLGVAEAEARRKLARRLAAIREKRALSQTVVAVRMGTSASVVSKLEAGGDIKMSTFQRYCAAIGETVTLAAAPARRTAR